MDVFSRLLAAILVVMFMSGCSMEGSTVGGRQFSEPTPGFTPKVTYNVDKNRMWTAVTSALTANNIAIAASSKTAGQITSDYLQGQTSSYGPLGMGGSGTSRYKYNIFIARDGSRTRLNVKAVLESSLFGQAGSTGYRDVSDLNPQIVDTLQNWMYEQIEKRL